MSTATATAEPTKGYQGTEKLLWGIVLAVVTFWLSRARPARSPPRS